MYKRLKKASASPADRSLCCEYPVDTLAVPTIACGQCKTTLSIP